MGEHCFDERILIRAAIVEVTTHCRNNIGEVHDVVCVADFTDEQLEEWDKTHNPCNYKCPCYQRARPRW